MKIVTLLIVVFMSTKPYYENLLGKPISEIKTSYTFFGEKDIDDKKPYLIGDFTFFGNQIKHGVLFVLDDQKLIEKIRFTAPVINRTTFDAIVDKYGEPDEMTKKDKVTTFKPVSSDGISATESVFTVIECTFDENPLFIIWKKNHYQIKITIKNEFNVSDVEFSATQ